MKKEISKILKENEARIKKNNARFNPVTGEGSVLKREKVTIPDFPIPTQYLPTTMLKVPLVKKLIKAGSVKKLLASLLPDDMMRDDVSYKLEYDNLVRQFIRVRNRHDFPFWAATFVYIKRKGGGEDMLFRLNRPQRRLVTQLENMRLNNKPIRLILLKARQWGGSTGTQIYMSWLQLVHKKGLNSLIVGHVKDASTEVKDMFDRMLSHYPVEMLHEVGEEYKENENKIEGVGKTGNIQRIPQRNCKIKIGTAEKPNSARGGDYNLVHLTEVGMWKTTEGKTPEEIVRSACGGMLYSPYTMIVYESTANGTGNLFHREYLAAKNGESQFEALFISWFEIEQYSLSFRDNNEKILFAEKIFNNRLNDYAESEREEPGQYIFRLWTTGATLENINWYITERRKYSNHGDMASEYPSDDVEAFTFSGRRVFPDEDIAQFSDACKPPKWVGEIYGDDDDGAEALENLHFKKEQFGRLSIWEDVEPDDEEIVTDRYLVVVDVCKGHTEKADYSVIAVFDRLFMMDADRPSVVAQWYGRIDMDRLAWKAAQIAEYYNHALLVIESNTLETNNTKGEAEYILNLIRNVYDNLYARKQSAEDIKEGKPRKYGYHTNVSTKKVIIHNLKAVLRDHLYTERDRGCLDEYTTYIEKEGKYEAADGHHDDRLMTRAIAMQICFYEMDVPQIIARSSLGVKHKRVVSAASI